MTYEEFKILPKPQHELFIAKFLHAVKNNATCFSYAALILKINMTGRSIESVYNWFLQLPSKDQQELMSELLQKIHQNESDFDYAMWVVEAAEHTGLLKDVHFNNDALKDAYAQEFVS